MCEMGHRRCSGVKASLQALSAAFMCKKCRRETPASMMAAEGLVVGREKCDIVDSFCYLGDMLRMEGDADAAVTARVRCAFQQEINQIKTKTFGCIIHGHLYERCAWKRFHELAPS